MTVNNPWIGYLDRSFIQIKRSILNRLGDAVPEMTDHSDSNILVVAIEFFSGIGEMLNYYIDNMAREAYITTCRRYSSAVKHTRLIDYRIKAKVAATVDLTLLLKNTDGDPMESVSPSLIPIGTIFSTTNGVQFISTEDTTVPTGVKSHVIKLKQQTKVGNDNLGVTTNSADQVFTLGKDYVHNTIEITIGGVPWLRQETLGRSGPNSLHYIVEISANQEAYIRFGDNINGKIPTAGQTILADYFESLGSLGNIEIGTITETDFDLGTLASELGVDTVDIYNYSKAVAGTDVEDLERIRRSAPLSLRTLDRAVTYSDYRDIALLCPGVDKAKEFFECGKYVYIYIAPNGGGIAQSGLIQDVINWFDDKKMVTTFIKPLPAGESYIYLELEVTGRFRVNGIQLRTEVIELLLEAYSYVKSDINKPIRFSDIVALVDNYYKVDFLKLKTLNLKPYIRPYGSNTTQLNHFIEIRPGSTSIVEWRIKFDGLYMILFKNNSQVATMIPSDSDGSTREYTDLANVMYMYIEAGPYQIGQEWTFKTLPNNEDIESVDYSIPVLIEENIDITVNEQVTLL